MEVRAKLEDDRELSQVLEEFTQWRAQRRSVRERIPEPLWGRAANLALRHGVNRVATLLHLERGGLGRRVALSKPNAPQFVELFAPAVESARSPAQSTESITAQCVVELVNVRGTKMRVVLGGTGVAGLSALCQAFCAAG